jgi:hypothetical protein
VVCAKRQSAVRSSGQLDGTVGSTIIQHQHPPTILPTCSPFPVGLSLPTVADGRTARRRNLRPGGCIPPINRGGTHWPPSSDLLTLEGVGGP